MKGLLVVDTKKCLGCHSCELGCAVAHSESKMLLSAVLEDPLPQARVFVEHYGGANLPLQCRHCEDAPCARVCPTKAVTKQGSGEEVLVDHALCIGCKWCLLVCPFGAVILGRGNRAVVKCDLCHERSRQGRQPACTESCPTGALKLVAVGAFTKEKRREFLVDFLAGTRPEAAGE